MYYILIVFNLQLGDMFLFTKPTFDSYYQCIQDISNPTNIKKYAKHLALIAPGKETIEFVYCIDEDIKKQIINSDNAIIEGINA